MDFIDYYRWYWEGGGHELLASSFTKLHLTHALKPRRD
jgi:hypothetical protein